MTLLRVVGLLGRHHIACMTIIVLLAVGIAGFWGWFVYDHGRLPVGNGELLNWVLGLSE